ncbi:MAG TPA: ABC transporter permease [Dehalococcoidia bacterium]|jgi:peptide/nickel transport system permease protein|nr:ABC transporter permease [Dehalococcoidia bacterium]
MRNYIIRRLLLMVPTVVVVAALTFMLLRLVPGNVLTAQLQGTGQAGAQYNKERLKTMEHQLGIDGSIPSQFGRWVSGMVHGNFGKSFIDNKDTLSEFGGRVGVTIELGILTIIFSLILGIPLGILSAVRQDSPLDYATRVLSILGVAIPNFWLALLIIVFAARLFGFAFPQQQYSFFSDPGKNLEKFVVPALVISFAGAGIFMRYLRTTMLDVLRQDYVRTANAKGLNQRAVVYRHALKNAIIPIITIIGAQLSAIIAGAIIAEQLFSLRGVGQLTLSAVLQRDYPQVQTNVLIFAIVLVVGNLVTDLAYGWADPRIRFS